MSICPKLWNWAEPWRAGRRRRRKDKKHKRNERVAISGASFFTEQVVGIWSRLDLFFHASSQIQKQDGWWSERETGKAKQPVQQQATTVMQIKLGVRTRKVTKGTTCSSWCQLREEEEEVLLLKIPRIFSSTCTWHGCGFLHPCKILFHQSCLLRFNHDRGLWVNFATSPWLVDDPSFDNSNHHHLLNVGCVMWIYFSGCLELSVAISPCRSRSGRPV